MSTPRPPADYDPAARSAFTRAASVLEALGEDVSLCVEPLRAYARAYGDVEALRRAWRMEGSPMVGLSANGQPIPHPYVGLIDRTERRAAEFAAALGLDPQARRKLSRSIGRPQGSASAADRSQATRRRLRAAS